ncbi:Peptide methionine sulfoxide reductase B2, chloroplastic [Pleodorina starrii]|uniref:Peptide-methionine (R)-S-oxide reductase n=1 Tax=Pleodorina starrii TaxID=330485 RepID=A0A9W6BL10_9CHLO|nr:Peptide methionine sulfoxide reductase B2, chloroplastic [Pleodorina starrii]GLC64477.1 Peptide methionine sulfoxide reductase B2 [Pleodorina starrii]
MLSLPAFKAATGPRLISSRRNAVPRRAVGTMATNKEGVNLDKNTPESVWKEVLNAEEYYILRQKGTERAGTGLYNKFYEDGVYKCAGCGNPLYKSETKFNSGCGWPAFYDEIPGAVDRHVDNSYGMKRVEITCANCGGHLGHVFEGEGFPTPTNQRHCVNSVSIKFEAKQ